MSSLPLHTYLQAPIFIEITSKAVFNQLQSYLNDMYMYQSGFCAMHSTESALLKVTNDPLLTAGFKGCSVRVLLDLTATFDTVDHAVLLERMEHYVGVKGGWGIVLG